MPSIEPSLRKPGRLVRFRGRRCVVQPSADPEVMLLRPLGGAAEETIAIFEPVMLPGEKVEEDHFEDPQASDLSNFLSARLLYNAARLSFRQVSGPFRCMGKLSFRPRSYQLVPLIMALEMPVIRLLIADDVGIGKTVEALLILREGLERGTLSRFAVLCPPHLCEQWQKELADKLDIEAVIIRSSTVASLERQILGDDTQNVFSYYPFQVISIDYVKGETKRPLFLQHAPDCMVVDEAHTCTKDISHKKSAQQQQRYELLEQLAANRERHLIFLTATPHSGKDGEFQSLLGLLNPEFEQWPMNNLSPAQKKAIARHFVQRKRGNLETWIAEGESPFPKRTTEELPYQLSDAYSQFYREVLAFARGLSANIDGLTANRARIRYFAALSLLRGVMSSPAAGFEMLRKRGENSRTGEEREVAYEDTSLIEKPEDQGDTDQSELMELAGLAETEWQTLQRLAAMAEALKAPAKGSKVVFADAKARRALQQIREWLDRGQSPIIFCRYIHSARYLETVLRDHLHPTADVRAITSELSDEERREKIDEMVNKGAFGTRRVLVATDCLSEGINLQEGFNAVLHYDLPWNPNRLEQREGRVDRYGQPGWINAKTGFREMTVDVRVLFGEDNPMDVVVLKIILEKIRRIQTTSGVSIALADDNRSVMDRVLREVLLNPERAQTQFSGRQLTMDFRPSGELAELDAAITREIETAREKAEKVRSIFAHEGIRPENVEQDLREVDEAIGNVATVEQFVKEAVTLLGGGIDAVKDGYVLRRRNLNPYLAEALGRGDNIHLSFQSPTPNGFRYLGRNHRFVELLCHRVLADALDREKAGEKAARAAVFASEAVTFRTVLVQFRVRNVIREVRDRRDAGTETVAEEMYLWGYTEGENGPEVLDFDACRALLTTDSAFDLPGSPETRALRQQKLFAEAMTELATLRAEFDAVVEKRTAALVEAHTRFAKYTGAQRYEAVTPVLPPDVLGVYVVMPKL